MRRRRSGEYGGSTLLEFTLIGIPMMFILLSTFEVARGMWLYHTLAYAVKNGTRYAIVHGSDCSTSPNSCSVTLGQIAGQIGSTGIGLDPNVLNLTFTPNTGAATTCLLKDCLKNSTTWPPSTANSPGMYVTISATYVFHSALAMFWPGSKATNFATTMFPASSKDIIQF
jgi:Flp pilus assembly protein TadG